MEFIVVIIIGLAGVYVLIKALDGGKHKGHAEWHSSNNPADWDD